MPYSIRLNESPGTYCKICRDNLTGEGPVGYCDDSPICDACLLFEAKDLGMLIALSMLTRAFAVDSATVPREQHMEGLSLLTVFARLYDNQAVWPRRNEFGDELLTH